MADGETPDEQTRLRDEYAQRRWVRCVVQIAGTPDLYAYEVESPANSRQFVVCMGGKAELLQGDFLTPPRVVHMDLVRDFMFQQHLGRDQAYFDTLSKDCLEPKCLSLEEHVRGCAQDYPIHGNVNLSHPNPREDPEGYVTARLHEMAQQTLAKTTEIATSRFKKLFWADKTEDPQG